MEVFGGNKGLLSFFGEPDQKRIIGVVGVVFK